MYLFIYISEHASRRKLPALHWIWMESCCFVFVKCRWHCEQGFLSSVGQEFCGFMHRELWRALFKTHTLTHNLNQTSPIGQQTDWASTQTNIADDLTQDQGRV